MRVPVLSGIYSDGSEFRTGYPHNLVPVPKSTGINDGYLGPSDGVAVFAAGPGIDRGGINWNGVCYRVMGTSLVSVASDGSVTTLGDVGAGGQVTLDYSFDRLAIASNGVLFYWNGTLTRVSDPDLGYVVDFRWIAGYFLTTDGTSLVVTELNDPYAVNPLKYGSSEADPDPVVGVEELRNEVYALNRYTIEVFNNVGGSNFPFQRVDGALVPRGCVGAHAFTIFAESIAFLGSGRNEAPAVYLINSGSTTKLSTREIDVILAGYTEAQLSLVNVEARTDKAHLHLLIHLPDVTWCYDAAASIVVGEPVWFSLGSSIGKGQYRAQNLVWCYDRWLCGDPQSSNVGELTEATRHHYGQTVGWDFGTMAVYNDGHAAIVHAVELVALPGAVALGVDPVIWHSYSVDGQTYSQERPKHAGKQGDRAKRLEWRLCGKMRNWRIERFRGTSDCMPSISRLEMNVEPCG